jgi:hypothetical protein
MGELGRVAMRSVGPLIAGHPVELARRAPMAGEYVLVEVGAPGGLLIALGAAR